MGYSKFFREQRRREQLDYEKNAIKNKGLTLHGKPKETVLSYLRQGLSEEHKKALAPFRVGEFSYVLNGNIISSFSIHIHGESGAHAEINFP